MLDPVLDIHVVFSVREDYLAELDDFKRALPGLFDRAHRLLPLTAFGAREAITRPLIARGIPFSPTLITKLVDELEKVGFEPPLLQIVCTEVYRRAVLRDPSALALNEEDLQRVGDLQDIFRRYLDALTREMSIARDSLLARNVFDALLTREGTKRAVTLADLTNAQFRASEAEVAEVLDVLVRRYVVRREIRNDVPWFELIHENVVESVKAWLDLDPDFVKFRSTRDLVVSVSRIGRSDGRFDVLLNKGQVEGMVGQFRSRFRFDKMQAAYVFLSAVKSGSDHAGYWADQMGPDVGASMLLEALDDRRPESREIRLGAATVAGVMTDPFGRIARALAGFSREPDEELRRAAARSYRHLVERYGTPRAPASPPPPSQETPAPAGSGLGAWWTQRTFQLEASPTYRAVLGLIRAVREGRPLEALRAASESVRAGNPEHDFLATRAEEGDPLLDQPFFERRLARRAAEVRIRRTHAKAVRNHGAGGPGRAGRRPCLDVHRRLGSLPAGRRPGHPAEPRNVEVLRLVLPPVSDRLRLLRVRHHRGRRHRVADPGRRLPPPPHGPVAAPAGGLLRLRPVRRRLLDRALSRLEVDPALPRQLRVLRPAVSQPLGRLHAPHE